MEHICLHFDFFVGFNGRNIKKKIIILVSNILKLIAVIVSLNFLKYFFVKALQNKTTQTKRQKATVLLVNMKLQHHTAHITRLN